MFIGLVGPTCSGKNTVCQFLIKVENFSLVGLTSDEATTRELKEGFLTVNKFGQEIRKFYSLELLLNYTTSRWTENFVIKDKLSLSSYDSLRKRPFFLLVAINSTLSKRFSRWKIKTDFDNKNNISFEDFINSEEDLYYNKENLNENTFSDPELNDHASYADLTLHNNTSTIEEFFIYLEKINLVNPERLRPSWDSYFMLLTELACMRSNCMKRRVGCLIVKDNRVIATGYNGTPRNVLNCSEGGCPRCNNNSTMGQDLDICLCIHAEENALLEAGRERISGGHSILYCNTCPCIGCAKKIVQVGIKEVVYSQTYRMDQQTLQLFKAAGIIIRRYIPPSISLHAA